MKRDAVPYEWLSRWALSISLITFTAGAFLIMESPAHAKADTECKYIGGCVTNSTGGCVNPTATCGNCQPVAKSGAQCQYCQSARGCQCQSNGFKCP